MSTKAPAAAAEDTATKRRLEALFEPALLDVGAGEGKRARQAPSDSMVKFQDTLTKLSRSIQKLQHDGVKGTAGWGDTRPPWGDKLVHWDDLKDVLPTVREGNLFLDVFFTEMQWVVNYISKDRLDASWKTLTTDGRISRFSASLICSLFATVYLLCPTASAAHEAIKREPERFRVLHRTARTLLNEGSFADDEEFVDAGDIVGNELGVTFDQLQAYTMYASYCSLAGLTKKTWVSVGEAVRLGKASDLFDESRWARDRPCNSILDDDEVEYRRRMAWALSTLDRWQGLHYYRAIDMADDFSVHPPSFVSGDPSDPAVRFGRLMMGQSAVIRDVYRFVRNLTRMSASDRRQQAVLIDGRIEAWYSDLPDWLSYENACCKLKADDPQSYKLAAQALLLHNSMYKLRCILMRPFLLDPAAPHEMRFAALRNARKILEAMPLLVTLSNNPWTIIPPSWPTHQLFVAASTFTIVFLSSPSESSATDGSTTSSEKHAYSKWPDWPAEDLDWFASNVFEAIDTLHLVGSGMTGATARVSKRLLVGLISEREKLRERFADWNEASNRAAQTRARKDTVPSVLTAQASSPLFTLPSDDAKPAATENNGPLSSFSTTSTALLPTPNSTPPGPDAFPDWPFMAPWEWAALTDSFDNGQLDFAT